MDLVDHNLLKHKGLHFWYVISIWSIEASWLEPLGTSVGSEYYKMETDIQTWQERRSAEYMKHSPLGSLNSVGGVATEINGINYSFPRSWLFHHCWHSARSKASALSSERGLSRLYEPVLYMRPID